MFNSGVDPASGPTYNSTMADRAPVVPGDYARIAVEVASEHQAADIVLLDVTGVSDFADYFVIATAESSRQMRVLAEVIGGALEEAGATLHHREGTHVGGWMLLDVGDLIVHLFAPEARDYYRIEEAWSGAVEVLRLQ